MLLQIHILIILLILLLFPHLFSWIFTYFFSFPWWLSWFLTWWYFFLFFNQIDSNLFLNPFLVIGFIFLNLDNTFSCSCINSSTITQNVDRSLLFFHRKHFVIWFILHQNDESRRIPASKKKPGRIFLAVYYSFEKQSTWANPIFLFNKYLVKTIFFRVGFFIL